MTARERAYLQSAAVKHPPAELRLLELSELRAAKHAQAANTNDRKERRHA